MSTPSKTSNKHVDTICAKATNILNLCRRNLSMCPRPAKELAYKAIVRPLLEYASTSWNPHTSRNIDKVEAVQRRAARWVTGNYTYGPDARLTEQIKQDLKWQTLRNRRALSDLNLFFKIRTQLVNIKFPTTVQLNPRKADKYQKIQANHSDAFKYSFFCRTVRLWNQLPLQASVSPAPSLDVYKDLTAAWIAPLTWHRPQTTGVWALA